MEKKTTTMSEEKTTSKKTAAKKMPVMPTLLQAIERVVEMSKGSCLSERFMTEAAPEIQFLSESFGITDVQAVLFCICMERGPRNVDYNDFAFHLDLSKIRVLSYANDIDALVRRRLLRYRDVKDEDDFDVPAVVIRYLKRNEVYQLPKRTELDCSEMFEVLRDWFDDLNNSAISPKDLCNEINELFKANKQVSFARQMLEMSFSGESRMLLTLFCHLLVNEDDNDVRFSQMEDVFSNQARFNHARGLLRSGEHELMQANLIEHRCEDGIADPNRYRMTEHAKRTLLAEMNVATPSEKVADMLRPQDLGEKQMFYSAENQKQVDELSSFFSDEQYRQIHERMQQRGFRNGFACLFYGGPGTGKTETVYQLARKTGRDIMIVDVPKIKSKWVGDSEKNIKALFDHYRELVSRAGDEKPAPILLFNEADAIIGIRKEGAQSAVDKMENSIQNIILQEMETLDGIMIATTNLADNLDTAFERRFLYKIKFDKPDAAVRAKIWQTMIPELTETDSAALAESYELSGGQIENVARKYAINCILHGDSANQLQVLRDYCNSERLCTKREARRVGF
ncbi:MAG: AAA family ATPase [Prevotella sp.]|nr:AAA family ATPase [Prevotella sp.]MBR4240568.1 AAA family ATPase [Prevotella sp.]